MDKYDNQEQYTINTAAIIHALDNTGIRMFMYYPSSKTITVPDKTCAAYQCKSFYANMPHSFAEDYVNEADYEIFKEMYYKIDSGAKTATAVFHSKDYNYCNHVTLTTVGWLEDGTPNEVLGIIEDMSDTYKSNKLVKQLQTKLNNKDMQDDNVQEAVNLIANSISNVYVTIFHIWTEDLSYICFQDETTDYSRATEQRKPINREHIKVYLEKYIEPEYKETMQLFFDVDTLAERLKSINQIEQVYVRKNNGWTKAQFIVAKRDANNNPTNIIFTVKDINNQIKQEENKKKAIYELLHDPLTNAYNRKGFDEITKKSSENKMPIVFAMLDIDNFKSLNDTYGHDVGDQVLKKVTECFGGTFRNEDYIFRLGGDEFAIILNNCATDIWKLFCRKQEYFHRSLKEFFPNVKDITLSVGMCYSENGYSEDMFKLADEALYKTKANGRSGCTFIDKNHNVLGQWRDERFTLQTETALDRSTTGVYRMEFPENADEAPRMLCNETTKLILGIESNATPEQCYVAWIKGIDPSYIEALMETRKTMIEVGLAECTYLWNHPTWGKIFVRSGGFGTIENGMRVLQGYHHALKNTKIIEKQDDSKLLFSALSDVYFASYYLDLDKCTYSIFKGAPDEDNLCMQGSISDILSEFIDVLVSFKDQEKMRDFVDLDTLSERIGESKYIDCEYRSQGIGGWCRARFIPVKYNDQGVLTHVLFVIVALDSAKAKELEVSDYNKRSLSALFNNVPGGIVMYEWDGHQLKTLHISDLYEKEYGYSLVSNEAVNPGGPDFKRVHPEDLESLQKAINKALTETHSLCHVFRVWNRNSNKYLYTRIDATVSPQSEEIYLIYAIYTDITEQKEAEINIEKKQVLLEAALDVSDQLCCEYDPQTHCIECLIEDNFLKLPQIIPDYPECMRDYNIIHPDDIDLLIETAKSVDGSNSSSCDVRCKKNGEYRWFNCSFSPYYDAEKERNIAIFTMYDITLRVEAMNRYEERLRSLLVAKENSMSMCLINVTKNTFKMVNAETDMNQFIDESANFETVMLSAADNIIGSEAQLKYRELFSRKNLLKEAEKGNMHIQYEYLIKLAENHYEWLTAVVDLIQNPVTGEISGVAYSNSTQKQKMSKGLLDRTLKQDYLFAAIIMTDTDEFYLYNSRYGDFLKRMENYWETAIRDSKPICSKEDFEQIKHIVTKKNVINHLENEEQYSFSYNGMYEGQLCRLEIRFSYLDDTHTMILASMRNITDKVLLDQFRYDSEHDSLTNLYNRKTVFNKCRELLDAHPEDQFAMLHMDMRHFRLFNTFFGDDAGDKLLCDIGNQLRNMSADYEYWAYGRIEADVFCAFFPYNQQIYEKHMKSALQYLKSYRSDFLIEPTIGLYFVKNREMSIEAMFTRATLAAKEVTPSTPYATVIYDEELESELNDKQQIINEMQTAIDEEEFKVYLQPKYSVITNQMVGAEALVRWCHPTKGIVSPGVFIPVFESNGFINTLDRYMWEHVCIILGKWKKEGKKLLPVSVNVSRISMFATSTVDYLVKLVKKYDIDPQYLQLELTESAYIDDPEEMKAQMLALRDAGFTILLDDFGSGYSCLNTLRELPVDVLKLDMKFLSLDSNDLRGKIVLSSIVRMSKQLKLVVIAEGVELQEQADFLKEIGCEYVQGYLYARPMTVEDYEKRL